MFPLCTVFIFLFLIGTTDVHAVPENELFQKIFGKKSNASTRLVTVPLLIDKREVSLIEIVLPAGEGMPGVDKKELVNILGRFIDSDIFNKLVMELPGNKHVGLQWLNAHGMSALYDPTTITLSLNIPASMRRIEAIHLRRPVFRIDEKDLVPQAKFSAVSNFFFSYGSSLQGNESASVVFDSAVNLHGWVAETEGIYRNSSSPAFSLSGTRLVYDIVPKNLRMSAGNIALPAVGFQASLPLTGILINKNYSLNPDTNRQPSGQKTFTLEHASTVDVMINGLRLKTLRLSAGRYDLRDFPIANGANDIKLVITDQFGRVHELNFPLFTGASLLAEGSHEYSYALGQTNSGTSPATNPTSPLMSGYHRYGVSETLTLGLNWQLDSDQYLIGNELHRVTSLGNFSLNTAMSSGSHRESGFAASLTYSYKLPELAGQGQRLWELSVSTSTPEFNTPGTLGPPANWDAAIGVSQSLGNGLHASLRSRFLLAHSEQRASSSHQLFLHKRLPGGMGIDFSYTLGMSSSGVISSGFSTHFSYQFGGGTQRLETSSDSTDRSRNITWHSRPHDSSHGTNTEFQITQRPSGSSYSGNVAFLGNRFEASVEHNGNIGQQEQQNTGRSTVLHLASAIVYADGHIGLSRPVSNSFVIIAPHQSLAGKFVTVDAKGESSLAHSDGLGPPVVSDLVPYHRRTLSVDVADLSPGQDIGNGLPVVKPGYRSGTVIAIGSDNNVILRGVLKTTENKIHSLKAGLLAPVGVKNTEAISFFTNRNGRFMASGLHPGSYRLQLLSYPDHSLLIEIPNEYTGIYNAGILQIK